MSIAEFYRGKKVLITGHTGFKGAWMCGALHMFGADITGYALEPPTSPALFDLCRMDEKLNSAHGDVCDLEHLKKVFQEVQPEIVIHMAAQSLVRESYEQPVLTYKTNVMGTVNVLECVRLTESVRSVVNVTTDKVYKNKEWVWGYREADELNGYDPYSNSKSCSELVTDSYCNSFFRNRDISVSTARAGNVLGGGDFAKDRIIPDCIKAAASGETIVVRNPCSTRPYQHVLDPVIAYLYIAEAQYWDRSKAGNYNVGPDDADCCSTGDLVDLFCTKWNETFERDISWNNISDGGPHEANFLKLDCSKIKSLLGWHPVWGIDTVLDKVIQWNKAYFKKQDIWECMKEQIESYLKEV